MSVPKSELDASQLEEEHVHKVYNQIAHNFSDTRHKPWPRVVDFLQTFSPNSLILDVGCGNGKYMNTRRDVFMVYSIRMCFFVFFWLLIVDWLWSKRRSVEYLSSTTISSISLRLYEHTCSNEHVRWCNLHCCSSSYQYTCNFSKDVCILFGHSFFSFWLF